MRLRALLVPTIAAVLCGAPSSAFAADPTIQPKPIATSPPGPDGVNPGSPPQSPQSSTIDIGGQATPVPVPRDGVAATTPAPTIGPHPAPAGTAAPAATEPTLAPAAPVGGVAVAQVLATQAPASLASPVTIDQPPPEATPAPAPIETSPPESDEAAAVTPPNFTLVPLVAGIGALALSAVLLALAVRRRGEPAAAALAAEGSASDEERVAELLRRRTERLGRIPMSDDPIVSSLGIPPSPPPKAEEKRRDVARRRMRPPR